MPTEAPQKPAAATAEPQKPDSPQVTHLKARRAELVAKMERVMALPEHRDHDHDSALARCRNGIAEIDRELKNTK